MLSSVDHAFNFVRSTDLTKDWCDKLEVDHEW